MSDEANKPSERERLEERVIALLFGELDANAAREVTARIEADAELRAFRDRMRVTLGLVSEASHTPDLEKEPVPQQLSNDRREALLAKFKVVPMPVKTWSASWSRHLALAAVAVALLSLVGITFKSIDTRRAMKGVVENYGYTTRESRSGRYSRTNLFNAPKDGIERSQFDFTGMFESAEQEAEHTLSEEILVDADVSPVPLNGSGRVSFVDVAGNLGERDSSSGMRNEFGVEAKDENALISGLQTVAGTREARSKVRAEIVLPKFAVPSEEETVAQIEAGTMVAKADGFDFSAPGVDAYFGEANARNLAVGQGVAADDFGTMVQSGPESETESLFFLGAKVPRESADKRSNVSPFARKPAAGRTAPSRARVVTAAPVIPVPTVEEPASQDAPARPVDRLSRRGGGMAGGAGGGGVDAGMTAIDGLAGDFVSAVEAKPASGPVAPVPQLANELRRLNEASVAELEEARTLNRRQAVTRHDTEAKSRSIGVRNKELKQLADMELQVETLRSDVKQVKLQQQAVAGVNFAIEDQLSELMVGRQAGQQAASGSRRKAEKKLPPATPLPAIVAAKDASGQARGLAQLRAQWFDADGEVARHQEGEEKANAPAGIHWGFEADAKESEVRFGRLSGGVASGFIKPQVADEERAKAGQGLDAILLDDSRMARSGALFSKQAGEKGVADQAGGVRADVTWSAKRPQLEAPATMLFSGIADEAGGEVERKAKRKLSARGRMKDDSLSVLAKGLSRDKEVLKRESELSNSSAQEFDREQAAGGAGPAKVARTTAPAQNRQYFFRAIKPQPTAKPADAPDAAPDPTAPAFAAAGYPVAAPQKPVERAQPKTLKPKPEVATRENAFSTFSLNVSDVAFKLAKASLDAGGLPDAETVRSEEFLNAFNYHDPAPVGNQRVSFAWNRARNPFAHDRELLRFSLQTAARGRAAGQPLNLVVLLDASGSMERADRERIVAEMLGVLVKQLQPADKISVVSFARTPRLLIDGMRGGDPSAVLARVTGQTPEGGTNIEAALDAAYEIARRHYLPRGNNRVILLTDGAANLGEVNPATLRERVEAERKQGVALDCFGVGWEGYNDDLLESLSRNGDGRYGFINDPAEARDGFANLLAGALQVAAADVKAQVEFNPGRVLAWRQIGYDKHQLTKEQFRDNTVDAAEIGAAESGTAFYSIQVKRDGVGPLGVARVRFRVPSTGEYVEEQWELDYSPEDRPLASATPAMRLAAVATGFAEWLTANPFAGSVTLGDLERLLNGVPEAFANDPRPRELAKMIAQARRIAGE